MESQVKKKKKSSPGWIRKTFSVAACIWCSPAPAHLGGSSTKVAPVCPCPSIWGSPKLDTAYGPDVDPQVLSQGQWSLPLTRGGHTLASTAQVFVWALPQGHYFWAVTWHGQYRCTVQLHSGTLTQRHVMMSIYVRDVCNFVHFVEDCVDYFIDLWSKTRKSWFMWREWVTLVLKKSKMR